MALLRGFLFCYCDVWALGSDMEVRPHNSLYGDVAVSYTHLDVYKRQPLDSPGYGPSGHFLPEKDFHRMYMLEIVRVYVKK